MSYLKCSETSDFTYINCTGKLGLKINHISNSSQKISMKRVEEYKFNFF